MAVQHRERLILIVLAGVIAVLVGDWLLLEPYLQWRDQLQAQRKSNEQAIGEDRALLARKHDLEQRLNRRAATISTDLARAENDLLHFLHQSEATLGVHNASFQRTQHHQEDGLDCLTYHITADGPMLSIAQLVYRLETAKLMLRVDELHVTSKGNDDTILLQANISTACNPRSELPSKAGRPADNSMAGVW